MKTWIIGVALNVIGSVSINLGTNLLKLAYVCGAETETIALAAGESGGLAQKRRTPVFYVGAAIFVVGNLLNFASFSFAAQSLLAALEPAFVTNLVFGVLLFGQRLTLRDVAATLSIIIGNILIVLFSSHDSVTYSSSELQQLYTNKSYISFMAVAFPLAAVFQFVYIRLTNDLESNLASTPWKFRAIPMLYALVSGILGTQSIIFSKSVSGMLTLSFQGDNQLTSWFIYTVLALWIGFMVFWLRRMNRSLQLFPGNSIIPVLQAVWIVMGVLSGGLYFNEFESLSQSDIGGFITGLTCILVGVAFLSPSMQQEDTLSETDLESFGKRHRASTVANRRKSVLFNSSTELAFLFAPVFDKLLVETLFTTRPFDPSSTINQRRDRSHAVFRSIQPWGVSQK